jgi:16S rRNA (guanine527-N7)-methyltransferase
MQAVLPLIEHYFEGLSTRQLEQFEAMPDLYTEWNARINLVSRQDLEHLAERHILHSLTLAAYADFVPGTRLLDVGTGGGFPGIPLAILFPECEWVLVDSIGKKIQVVQAVAEALGLTNVTALNQRAETVKGTFDFVVTRAVARLATLYPWVQHKIHNTQRNTIENGILALKGGDLAEEIAELTAIMAKGKRLPAHCIERHPLHEAFPLPFFETKQLVYVKRHCL